MEFTHDEASLIVKALNDCLESTEEQYFKTICLLEEGCLISPVGLEETEKLSDKLQTYFDIQEKIFSVHPCLEAREMLLEELEENREILAESRNLLASLTLRQSPSSQDENKDCDKDESCSFGDTKNPEHSEVEKIGN